MREILRCPVCLLLKFPDMLVCENGHSVCSDCNQKIRFCPVCRGEMTDRKNVFYREFFNNSKFTCPFASQGCSALILGSVIKQHATTCGFRIREPPLKRRKLSYSRCGSFFCWMRGLVMSTRQCQFCALTMLNEARNGSPTQMDEEIVNNNETLNERNTVSEARNNAEQQMVQRGFRHFLNAVVQIVLTTEDSLPEQSEENLMNAPVDPRVVNELTSALIDNPENVIRQANSRGVDSFRVFLVDAKAFWADLIRTTVLEENDTVDEDSDDSDDEDFVDATDEDASETEDNNDPQNELTGNNNNASEEDEFAQFSQRYGAQLRRRLLSNDYLRSQARLFWSRFRLDQARNENGNGSATDRPSNSAANNNDNTNANTEEQDDEEELPHRTPWALRQARRSEDQDESRGDSSNVVGRRVVIHNGRGTIVTNIRL